MLPGPDMQAEILNWCGGCNGMSPCCSEPFDRPAVRRLQSDSLQIIEHVVQAHCAQAIQERSGIIQHHSWFSAVLNELWNELAHALVTPVEHRRIMVIADLLVIHHIFQI